MQIDELGMQGYNGTSSVMPKRLKTAVKGVLLSDSMSLLRARFAGLAGILMYHRIVDCQKERPAFDPNIGISVCTKCFEEQLSYLSTHYRCISLPELITRLKSGSLERGTAALTFDDGYRDNLELALPLLEKYNVPATIYVTTGLIERTSGAWWYEQEFIIRRLNDLSFGWGGVDYNWPLHTNEEKSIAFTELNRFFKKLNLTEQNELMQLIRSRCQDRFSYDELALTWEELKDLDRHPLITIGAHTVNHPNLRLCREEELDAELRECKLKLEEKLEHAIDQAAYPFGSCNEAGPREFSAAGRSGFAAACTTRLGHIHREHARYLFALPRICIDYYDDMPRFRWKLSGCYAMVQQRGRRVVVD